MIYFQVFQVRGQERTCCGQYPQRSQAEACFVQAAEVGWPGDVIELHAEGEMVSRYVCEESEAV